MWQCGILTLKLDPIQDSDTVNMDSVGSGAETLHKRQVRISRKVKTDIHLLLELIRHLRMRAQQVEK